MSKGLEALEQGFWKLTHIGNIRFYNIIEKELLALEVIKEKRVDVSWFYYSDNADKYNSIMEDSRRCLTQEEFDLVKGVLS